jgi:hypothetical protein
MQDLAQNSENNSEGLGVETKADICISDSLIFMWYVVRSFRFAVSVAASPKP